MNSIIKLLSSVLIIVMLVSFVGCGEKIEQNKAENKSEGKQIIASEMRTVGNRQVPYHNGKPYLYNPMHFRYDYLLKNLPADAADKALDDGMRLIKEAGFSAVMIYVPWEKIYDGKKYDLTYFTKQFNLAQKYDLKVHIVWFGSNVTGFGGFRGWQTDREKYPALIGLDGAPVEGSGYGSGKQIPDFSNPIYAEEEGAAILEICKWLNKNDKDCRTVAIQLEDEPDNNEGGFGQWMSQFTNYVAHLNRLAKVVKESPYSMIAYVNIMSVGYADTIEGYTYAQRIKYIAEQEYIDFVGYSYYTTTNKTQMKELEFKGHFPCMVGFSTAPFSVPAQTLDGLAGGYGLCYYQFFDPGTADTGFYSLASKDKIDGTIYGKRNASIIINDTPFTGALDCRTSEFIDMNKSINALSELIAVTDTKMMTALNNRQKVNDDTSKKIDGEKITFIYKDDSVKYGAVGFALKHTDGNFYAFATMTSELTFTSDISVTVGKYVDGNWVSEGEVAVNNNTFTAEGGKAYQIVIK